MKTEQRVLPFKPAGGSPIKDGRKNAALIGKSFLDGSVEITVMSVCQSNPNQVMVERDVDGKRWSVPVGVIRLIVGRRKKRRAA